MKNIIFIFLLFYISIGDINAQTLHAIVVSNTFDESIGSACIEDAGSVFSELKNIAQVLNYEDQIITIEDNDFSIEQIEIAISNIECSPNDVVFFYYTGHGARAAIDNSKWPQLSINKNGENKNEKYLPLLRIFDELKTKNSRLLFVLADCCNNISNRVLPKTVTKGQTTVKDKSQLIEVYKSLFNDVSGTILASSSKPGETSIALTDQGSLFTMNYFKTLAKALNGEMKSNWDIIFEESSKHTLKFAEQNGESQNPQFDLQLKSKISPIPPSPTNNTSLDLINDLVDMSKTPTERIRLFKDVEQKAFANSDVIVETYAKNSKTLIDRETANEYVKRLATSSSVVQVIEIESSKDENGRYTMLKVQEIIQL